jgi:hypothetical protein
MGSNAIPQELPNTAEHVFANNLSAVPSRFGKNSN